MNRVPKYVASRSLSEPLSWSGSSLLNGDPAESVAELKERFGEVHVIGSLDLVQSLLRHELIDEFHLWLYPLVLGTGKRVFAGGTVPAQLRLTESIASPNGMLRLTYEPAGKPTFADIG